MIINHYYIDNKSIYDIIIFMKQMALFLFLSLWASLCLAQGIRVYFSPNGGCQQAVVEEIAQATQSIDIAMYYLSSTAIARSIIKAKDRHVHVRIVLDQGQEIEDASKSSYLVSHGIDLRYHLGFGLMHNKFAIIDGKVLITGSFNWTRTAEENNEENMLIISDTETITKYQERFEYLWRTSRSDSRNARGVDALPAWSCSNLHLFCTN